MPTFGTPPRGVPRPKPFDTIWKPTDSEPISVAKLCFKYEGLQYDLDGKIFWYTFTCLHSKCRNKPVSIKTGKGYSNLVTHVQTENCVGRAHYHDFLAKRKAEAMEGSGQATLRSYVLPSPRDEAVYQILRWLLVDHDLPLKALDDKNHKRFSKYEDYWKGSQTMKKYMFTLQDIVKNKLKDVYLPDKFAIHLDGWTSQGIHYLAILATFMYKPAEGKEEKLKEVLLSISPMGAYKYSNKEAEEAAAVAEEEGGGERRAAAAVETDDGDDEPRLRRDRDDPRENLDEDLEEEATARWVEATDFKATTHLDHIKKILEDNYGKNIDANVSNFCGDNCSTNIKLALLAKKPFVGCASHRHSLEINHFTKEQPNMKYAVDTTHAVMTQAKQLKTSAALRNLTHLRAKVDQPTRWSSKAAMLNRFQELIEYLKQIAVVRDLLPFQPFDRLKVQVAAEVYANQNKYCLELQKQNDSTPSLQRTRLILELAAKDLKEDIKLNHLTLDDTYSIRYLMPDSVIVKFKDFENGVRKLQQKHEDSLIGSEIAELEFLLKEKDDSGQRGGDDLDYCEPSATDTPDTKRRKKERRLQLSVEKNDEHQKVAAGKKAVSKYINPNFILGVNNTLERCFSRAKRILSDSRAGMSPRTFEAILFLKLNEEYWNVNDVALAINASNCN